MDEEYCEICWCLVKNGKMPDHMKVHALTMDIRR